MGLISNLYFSAFLIYMFFGVYSLFYTIKFPRNKKIYLVFFLLCLNMAVWSLLYSLITAAPDEKAGLSYYIISQPFMFFFPFFFLLFYYMLIENNLTDKSVFFKTIKKFRYALLILLAVPPLFFTIEGWSGPLLITGFRLTAFGWQSVHAAGAIFYYLFIIYYLSYFFACIGLNILWGAGTDNRMEKLQSSVILVSSIITLVINFTFESLLPVLHYEGVPKIAQIITLLWVFGIGFAMRNYSLMTITTGLAADEIILNMINILFLVDRTGRIVNVNRQAERLMGYERSEMLGKPADYYFLESLPLSRELENSGKNDQYGTAATFHLKTKSSGNMPVNIHISAITGITGEIIGKVILAEDLRQNIRLLMETEKRIIAEKDLQNLSAEMDKVIADRCGEFELISLNLRKESEERKKINEQLFTAFTRMRLIFNTSPYAIVLSDLEGNIEDCNIRMLQMIGRSSKDEIIGRNSLSFMSSASRVKAEKKIVEVLKKGFIKRSKFMVVDKEGDEYPVHVSAIRIDDYNGNPTGIAVYLANL